MPKFTVIIGGSFGAGNYGMCGRAYQPRQLWMWPNARISVMGGEQAASVLAQVKQEQLERQGKAMTAGRGRGASRPPSSPSTRRRAAPTTRRARLWDDGVIPPAETRTVLGLGHLRRPQRPDPGDALRRLPDVSAAGAVSGACELERLQLEFDGPVARVWLNRPDVRNAFDGLMVTELRKVLFDLRTVDAVRVIVLGGRGPVLLRGRATCSG